MIILFIYYYVYPNLSLLKVLLFSGQRETIMNVNSLAGKNLKWFNKLFNAVHTF